MMNEDDFIQQQQATFQKILARLVSFADFSETGEQIRPAANYLVTILKELLHADVQLHETGGSPVITVTISPGKDHTYLFYGHYDVQLPGELAKWQTDPFQLTAKDGRFFGRGVGDNKGQLVAQICGFYTYQQVYGDLPFTAILFIEGEEESGSPHLRSAVTALKKSVLSKVDAAIVTDGSYSQSGQHVLRLGNRGGLAFRLTTHTADTNLHSGNFGNVSSNAAIVLMRVLNKLIDPVTQRPRVPALRENIAAPTATEIQWLNELPAPHDVPSPLYHDKLDYYRRLMFEPTLSINGLVSGYQGPKGKTIIPGEATAILDSRLVPGQTCAQIRAGIEQVFAEELQSGLVTLQWLVQLNPTKTDPACPLIRPVEQSIKEATGACLIEPVMPGSVPNDVWTEVLQVPVLTIPYANYDQHNHAPNENLLKQAFLDGIKITVALGRNLPR